MLTPDELERYNRQIMINGLGEKGQAKLKKARVFIAGAGGLGSPAALYLAATGVGTIRIVDHEKVELSNLNRQILYGSEDIGQKKTDAAPDKLQRLNPDITIDAVCEMISEDKASHLTDGFDLIVDALDNLPTRYILNKTALRKNIPIFHGAVYGFEGRVTTIIPGRTACLMCLYHGLPGVGCPQVIGVTPAIIGSIQATEAIKYITGTGELLADRLLVFDGLSMTFTEFKIKKDPACQHCGHSAGKG